MAIRRPRRSIVVAVGVGAVAQGARALAESVQELGVQTTYLGREESAQRIAAAVVERDADAIELCLGEPFGAPFLRELLQRLADVGRRDVSIVAHRQR